MAQPRNRAMTEPKAIVSRPKRTHYGMVHTRDDMAGRGRDTSRNIAFHVLETLIEPPGEEKSKWESGLQAITTSAVVLITVPSTPNAWPRAGEHGP